MSTTSTTSPELFDDSAVTAPSPCKRWKELHKIDSQDDGDEFCPQNQRWSAWKRKEHPQRQCFGETEVEALSALAKRLGLSLWDEGGAK